MGFCGFTDKLTGITDGLLIGLALARCFSNQEEAKQTSLKQDKLTVMRNCKKSETFCCQLSTLFESLGL